MYAVDCWYGDIYITWTGGMEMYIMDWWYGDLHCGLVILLLWRCTVVNWQYRDAYCGTYWWYRVCI